MHESVLFYISHDYIDCHFVFYHLGKAISSQQFKISQIQVKTQNLISKSHKLLFTGVNSSNLSTPCRLIISVMLEINFQ